MFGQLCGGLRIGLCSGLDFCPSGFLLGVMALGSFTGLGFFSSCVFWISFHTGLFFRKALFGCFSLSDAFSFDFCGGLRIGLGSFLQLVKFSFTLCGMLPG